ncbi:hypothetical protein JZ751_012622, partial [Albula glossodonta]
MQQEMVHPARCEASFELCVVAVQRDGRVLVLVVVGGVITKTPENPRRLQTLLLSHPSSCLLRAGCYRGGRRSGQAGGEAESGLRLAAQPLSSAIRSSASAQPVQCSLLCVRLKKKKKEGGRGWNGREEEEEGGRETEREREGERERERERNADPLCKEDMARNPSEPPPLNNWRDRETQKQREGPDSDTQASPSDDGSR